MGVLVGGRHELSLVWMALRLPEARLVLGERKGLRSPEEEGNVRTWGEGTTLGMSILKAEVLSRMASYLARSLASMPRGVRSAVSAANSSSTVFFTAFSCCVLSICGKLTRPSHDSDIRLACPDTSRVGPLHLQADT